MKKALFEVAFDTIIDAVIVLLMIAVIIAAVNTYVNADDVINADMLASKISFALKEVYAAGEGSKLTLELPKRYCKIKITQEEIYVNTETGIWKSIVNFLKLINIWAFFGLEPSFAEIKIENPVGKYMDKNGFKGKCSSLYRKKIEITYEKGAIHVREISI